MKDLPYTDERRHDNRLLLFLQKENRFNIESQQWKPIEYSTQYRYWLISQFVGGKQF